MVRKIAIIFSVLILMLLANKITLGQNVVVTDDDSYPVDSSAMLDIKSDSKGLLIPRLTITQRTEIKDPANGLLVYDSDLDVFYYFNGSAWINISKGQVWEVDSNYVYLSSETGNVGIGTSTPNSKLEVRADDSFTVDDTLFVVKDKNGNAVFAVFPYGVKVIVDEASKGKVGGFAISGRSPSKKGVETDIFIVTPDSTRVFVNDTMTMKGKVGGFAISGRSPSKGITNEYFIVTGDSTRVYVNDSATVKGKVGGFAISGRSPSKGTLNEYMQVTRDSTRVYVTESETKGKVGGFAISGRSPSKGTETDYFNVSGNLSAQTIDPSEARIFWYPKKEAFLTGRVLVENSESVGTNSFVSGYESKASGEFSQAMGYKSYAIGDYSTAIGINAEALGNNSFAFGDLANANNDYSFAFGNEAVANGHSSIAIGSNAQAKGTGSFAFGSSGVDTAGYPIDEATEAAGDYAFALGFGARAENFASFALGNRTKASNTSALAMGFLSEAQGYNSTAMGNASIASGRYSTTIGRGTKSRAYASFAIGSFNDTSASSSTSSWVSTDPIFIVGNGTSDFSRKSALTILKNGNIGIGIGKKNPVELLDVEGNTRVDGEIRQGSVDYGGYEIQTGGQVYINDYLIAMGGAHIGGTSDPGTDNLVVDGEIRQSITDYGAYEIQTSGQIYTNDYLVAMGGIHVGGTSDPGTDNLIVNGNIGIGTTAPQEKLHVEGTIEVDQKIQANDAGGLDFATDEGTIRMKLNDNGRIGIHTTSPASELEVSHASAVTSSGITLRNILNGNRWSFYMQEADGDLSIRYNGVFKGQFLISDGTYAKTSDLRLKKNFEEMNNTLEKVALLTPTKYHMKVQESNENKKLGFVAQDVKDIFPELVFYDQDEDLYTMDYSGFGVIAIAAIKEQQNIIDELKKENEEFKTRLTQIEELLKKE